MKRPRLFFRNWWTYQKYQNQGRRKSLKNPLKYVSNDLTLLSDPDYLLLSAEERGWLHGMFLLAASDAGHVDSDPKRVAVSLHLVKPIDLASVFSEWVVSCELVCNHLPTGWELVDNKLPSDNGKGTGTETGTETGNETGKGTEKTTLAADAAAPASPSREKDPTNEKPRKLTDFQTCLEHWKVLHLKTLKAPYLSAHSRDNKCLTPVIQTYGLEGCLELIGYFWDEQLISENGGEGWIGKSTPSVPNFVSKIPLILKHYTLEACHG